MVPGAEVMADQVERVVFKVSAFDTRLRRSKLGHRDMQEGRSTDHGT